MRFLLAAAAICVSFLPASAAEFSDPDWPCIQRKVPHLSVGQMWAGPPIEEADLDAWRRNDAVAALAPLLAVRRTGENEADRLIAEFASSPPTVKDRDMALLFAGVFSLIERERTAIIAGIGRYARRQTALSAAIEDTRNRLTELRQAAEPDLDIIEELADKLIWDTRIFKERTQSLSYVCETPVILERRAFAVARMMQSRLNDAGAGGAAAERAPGHRAGERE